MAITQRPKTTVESFIETAPDGAEQGSRKRVIKGKKVQITLTIPEELLSQADAAADASGLSRASWMNLAIRNALARGMETLGN